MPELLHFPRQTELADAAERASALDIGQSWIVEAPAGSGKTGLLIQRYLKLLADTSVTGPEQVLAITFTTKATAELRERVLAQLQSAAAGAALANDFDRATRPFARKVLLRSQSLNWSLLEQPTRLNIRTIDSVCAQVTRALPILSGGGGRLAPIEDAGPLYALAAHRTFLELGGPDRDLHDALSKILLYRDGNLAECEKLLGEMLVLRDQWIELVPIGQNSLEDAWLDANVLPKLERTLDHVICTALTHLEAAIPPDVLDQLALAAADMAHLDGYKGNTSPIVVCAGRRGTPGATAENLEHWKALMHLLVTRSGSSWRKVFGEKIVGFKAGKFEKDQLRQIVGALRHDDQLLTAICKLGTLPPARYPADQWAVTRTLFRILNRALAELKIVFAERGECDFAEVSLAARTALQSGDGTSPSEPALETALGMRLQHILVDEMQDTSSGQYDLLEALTRSWDGHSQTAFLVGDPKQSIYLFRQARVERFLRTMRTGILGDLPLGTLRLTANFRSQPALVDDFNADFSAIFPAGSSKLHPEEVPYVFATAARTEAGHRETPPSVLPLNYSLFDDGLTLAASASVPARVWHDTILPYETGTLKKSRNASAQRFADAAEVCRIVNTWRFRPSVPNRASPNRAGASKAAGWKIAVLCRSRSHLVEIVSAFKSAAIPFRAVDIDPLEDRPEVQDLVALTRALLHPADRVAWLAILHAPWCGLSLAELHILAGADDPAWAERSMQHVVAERGHLLPDEACQRLARIWPALEAAVDSRARLSIAQLVERTWRSLGGSSCLNATELANAARYFRLLSQIEAEIERSSGGFELPLLERRLDKLYAAPSLEPGAVDLLTIHKAKGLEWDVVIVPGLERRAPIDRPRLLNWVELDSSDQQSAHFLLAPIKGKGDPSLELTKWISGIHNAREAAERKRVFYVACTRAREELHLFAAPARTAGGTVKPVHDSLLNAAWPAAEAYFVHLAEDASDALTLAGSAGLSAPGCDTALDEPGPSDDLEDPDAPSGDDPESDIMHGPDQFVLPITTCNAPTRCLPLSFNPAAQFVNERRLGYGEHTGKPATAHFERPEGSLAARAFGNAVHAFLEQMTQRLAASESAASLLAGLPGWTPRITAILRSEGLQPSVVERLTQRVLFALETTLNDPRGLWLLSPHEGAATEYALTAWTAQRSNIRIDRLFLAGSEPLAAGSSHLWIVDFKTTTHGTEGLEAFLLVEKTKYAPQLETYAGVLSAAQSAPAIRLALYYPLIAKLIWWQN